MTAMLDLAIHYEEGPVTLAGISETQGISLSYLEQLFVRLKKNGLVEGWRGPGGGYRLARSPEDISIAQIINAIGEGIDATMCGGNEDCQDGDRCLTHALWENMGSSILDFMDGITLASFLRRDKVNAVVIRQQSDLAISVTEPTLNNTAGRPRLVTNFK